MTYDSGQRARSKSTIFFRIVMMRSECVYTMSPSCAGLLQAVTTLHHPSQDFFVISTQQSRHPPWGSAHS